VFPVLLDFRLPDFLGQLGWKEMGLTLSFFLLLWLWFKSRPCFQARAFAFWSLTYLILRLVLMQSGAGFRVQLYAYPALMCTGFVTGVLLIVRRARKESIPINIVWDICLWVVFCSMVGARVFFIAVNINHYLAQPGKLLTLEGGMVFYGGMLGAMAAGTYICQKHQISLLKITDLVIPAIALGHAFGRMGCFAAGCCHGLPTRIDGFGAIFRIDGTAVSTNHYLGVPLHPTQLYEAFGELVIFFILLLLTKRKSYHGQLFLTYLFLYASLRSGVEMFRGDNERGMLFQWDLFGDPHPELLSIGQVLSLILVSTVLIVFWRIAKRRRQLRPKP
jgi:phosphatidylglycerol:prolipoprotein diacylglycerol transferase